MTELTALLRNSADPFWVRLRQLLPENGVSVETTIIATSFPDDTSLEFGVVVTHDRRVYQFGFEYLGKRVEEGSFNEWVDLTERHSSSPYRDKVALALDLLRES